jgi:hypothetical protein
VAVAALALEAAQAAHGGGTLAPWDFSLAFFVMGLIAASSAWSHFRLPADAGAEVAGRAPVRDAAP